MGVDVWDAREACRLTSAIKDLCAREACGFTAVIKDLYPALLHLLKVES